MAYTKTAFISSPAVFRPTATLWAERNDFSVLSAYASASQKGGRSFLYVESCHLVDPRTGITRDSNPFGKGFSSSLKSDRLYTGDEEFCRFEFTESAIDGFSSTFSDHGLTGDEFAVALTAYIAEENGQNPWVLIRPDQKNLLEFCIHKGWAITIPGNGGSGIPDFLQQFVALPGSEVSPLISSVE